MKTSRAQTPNQKKVCFLMEKKLFQIHTRGCTGTFVHLPIITVQMHVLLPTRFCSPYFKGKIEKTSAFSFSGFSCLLFATVWFKPWSKDHYFFHIICMMKHILSGPEFVIVNYLLGPVLRQRNSPLSHLLMLIFYSSIVLFLEVFYNINYT